MSDHKHQGDQPPAETPEAPETAEAKAGPGGEAEAAARAAGEAVGEGALEGSLEERLAAAEQEIASLKDQRLRALAETENLRKRAARERDEAARYAVTAFARDILTVADNLRRALDTIDAEARAADPALDALVVGVEMTEKQLLAVFERYGIVPIAAEGQRFDPHVHDAMFEVPDESVPAGTVVRVVETGYMIHDRPLRPARVGVSRGGPKAEPPPKPEEPDNVTTFPGGSASAYERRSETAGDASGSQVDQKL